MKEYLRMKDAFWCKIKFGNYGVRCFIEGSDPPWIIDFWDAKTKEDAIAYAKAMCGIKD